MTTAEIPRIMPCNRASTGTLDSKFNISSYNLTWHDPNILRDSQLSAARSCRILFRIKLMGGFPEGLRSMEACHRPFLKTISEGSTRSPSLSNNRMRTLNP